MAAGSGLRLGGKRLGVGLKSWLKQLSSSPSSSSLLAASSSAHSPSLSSDAHSSPSLPRSVALLPFFSHSSASLTSSGSSGESPHVARPWHSVQQSQQQLRLLHQHRHQHGQQQHSAHEHEIGHTQEQQHQQGQRKQHKEQQRAALHSAAAEFPGARVQFTHHLALVAAHAEQPIPCFHVLDHEGHVVDGAQEYEVDRDLALAMYGRMVQLQSMDSMFYEAQRQGRFSFYMTTAGEEAINIASAAAIDDQDYIFAQYREAGVLLWRGFTFADFSNQCFGNQLDSGKGRQMPIHYGSAKLRFHTISSPLGTQIPHAVGAAYSLKTGGERCCAVTYFGEGAASEGDFHGAMNLAAVLEAPVLFVCRNNGWAISTPAKEQYRGDGIAGRAQAYGVAGLRVDGNDALAVYAAVKAARQYVVDNSKPLLLEALTYRTGHHSTSDDSSRYRGVAEIEHWKSQRDPTLRLRRWIERKGWWDEGEDKRLREASRNEVIAALEAAEKVPKPALAELFTDVYDEVPTSLAEQEQELRRAVATQPSAYPAEVPF